MRVAIVSIVVASTLSMSSPVFAQAAAEPAAAVQVAKGTMIYDAAGRRVGRVEYIIKDKDGAPATVAVIYGSKFVYIPVSTISSGEKGQVTSLDRGQLSTIKP